MTKRRTARVTTTTMTTENGVENTGRYDTNTTQEVSPLEITNDDLTHDSNKQTTSISIEEQYHTEREQSKQRHWKESEYAAGLVELTWEDEREKYRRQGCCCPDREALGQMFQEEIDPGCGCIYLSAVVCSRLGAGRIGNMAVLKERFVMVEVDDDDANDLEGQEQVDGFVDDEDGLSLHQRNNGSSSSNSKNDDTNNSNKTTTKRLVRKREIQFVLGPFWPMLLFITYPLIFGMSAFTFHVGLPGKPIYVQILWSILTGLLIYSLFNTGFRDPGILASGHVRMM